MSFVDLPTGARLHVEDVGSGAPVIALHGMLGTARTNLAQVIDWLSVSYRVIAPTLRGYGESSPKPRDFPPDFYHRDAEDVLALMDVLDVKQAHLLGYSDGGEVALICAGKQPQRFRSVAVWGAVGYFGPDMRAAAQRLFPATWMSDADKTLHGIDHPDAFILGWIKAMHHMIDSGGDVSLSLAGNITCPLLLMLGQEDKLNPEAYGRALVERTPQGRLEMFPGGHAVHNEQWETFQRAISAHLKAANEG